MAGLLLPGVSSQAQSLENKSPLAEPDGFVKATIGSDSLRHFHVDSGGPPTEDQSVRYRADVVLEDSFTDLLTLHAGCNFQDYKRDRKPPTSGATPLKSKFLPVIV